MKNALYILLIFACVFVGFSNRSFNIRERIPHADEAEQASVFLNLFQNGEYKYNPNGPHGPTLYYYAAAAANMAGSPAPVQITVNYLRSLLLPFSLLIMALYILFSPYVGRMAAWGACAAFCLSATASIYSVYFVQEIIFAAAILALAQAVWKFALKPSALCAAAIGIFAAAAQSTKETAAIAYPAILLALAIAASLDREMRENLKSAIFTRKILKFAAWSAGGFIIVFATFYSSFGDNWRGVIDAFLSYAHFVQKAGSPEHSSGFAYYLKLLAIQKCEGARFGELPILLLSIGGFLTACFEIFKNKKDNKKAIAVIFMFSAATANIFLLSCISYKTPWLILSPILLLFICAGYAIQKALSLRRPAAWIVSVLALCAAGYWQYGLTKAAAARYNCDPRNPFIYSHTVKDFGNLIKRVEDCAKVSEYGSDIPVAFITANSPWPAPWYLRNYRNVGYWDSRLPQDIGVYEIIVCDSNMEEAVSKSIDKSKYASEFFGLRKNLILTVYIKKELFDTLIEGRK